MKINIENAEGKVRFGDLKPGDIFLSRQNTEICMKMSPIQKCYGDVINVVQLSDGSNNYFNTDNLYVDVPKEYTLTVKK